MPGSDKPAPQEDAELLQCQQSDSQWRRLPFKKTYGPVQKHLDYFLTLHLAACCLRFGLCNANLLHLRHGLGVRCRGVSTRVGVFKMSSK